MRDARLKSIVATATALALCATPTMAAATPAAPVQSLNPLVAVSLFGTQASAQTVCTQTASAAAAAGSAAVQGQTGCVLPVVDAPPPAPQVEAVAAPVHYGFGISPVLLGLLGIAALAALIASQSDDNNSNSPPVSPD